MLDIYRQGGALFMNMLTLLLILMLIFFIIRSMTSDEKWYSIIKNLGITALALGILGQFIGLFSAMQHIETAGGINSGILAGGIKVSMITTIYGLIIFIISKLLLILKPEN